MFDQSLGTWRIPMISRTSRLMLFVCFLAAWFSFVPPLSAQTADTLTLLLYWAQNSSTLPNPAQTSYTWNTRANANVDECFYGLADSNPSNAALNNASFFTNYPADFSADQITNCVNAGAKPKINQAYVWGLTVNGNDVWFGTVANTLCLVMDSFYGGVPDATLNNDYVCDAKNNPLEDTKPPRIYVYNSQDGILDLTPKVVGDPNLYDLGTGDLVIGLRSAGNYNGVVFFGGLNRANNVVMFAFNADTKDYIGSYVFDGQNGKMGPYINIRQWHTYNGQLYTGVATPSGGQILRWSGSVEHPFQFEVVGNIGGDPAYFTLHSDNRIYVSTWPVNLYAPTMMSIWMSPALHDSPLQLTTADASSWTKVWDLSQYEVEPSAIQGGGAIASYGGYLYFGTMHVPGTGAFAFTQLYGQPSDVTAAFLGSYRPVAIFRSTGFAVKKPTVQLLYGNEMLPKFNAKKNSWTLVHNNLKQAGLYGTAGFGNFFNNYTWAAEVYNNQLFIGTMDFSYLTSQTTFEGISFQDLPSEFQQLAQQFFGADLWYFTSNSEPAALINGTGLGNQTSYGVRNLAVGPDSLWLGMANPMNLRSDSTNNPGGWKLIQLQ